jgi:hypothetical protein
MSRLRPFEANEDGLYAGKDPPVAKNFAGSEVIMMVGGIRSSPARLGDFPFLHGGLYGRKQNERRASTIACWLIRCWD